MKKLLLPLLLCFWFIPNVNAQIVDLTQLILTADLSNEQLHYALSYDWEFKDLTELQSDQKTYSYTFNNGITKQLIFRNVTMLNGDLINTTSLVTSNASFLEELIDDMKKRGFVYFSKEENKVVYEKPNYDRFIMIEDKGVAYKISILGTGYAIEMEEETFSLNTNSIRYQEIWDIIGTEKNDKGTFEIVKYEDWSCSIILTLSDNIYTSFECNEEGKAKLKDTSGNVIEIEFAMPELVDVMIDILGNDIRFDYTTSY